VLLHYCCLHADVDTGNTHLNDGPMQVTNPAGSTPRAKFLLVTA